MQYLNCILKAKKALAVSIMATAAMWLSGCAGTTVFTSYPSKISPLITNLQQGKPISFDNCLLSECKSRDLILYNMERGRIAQIMGNVDMSMDDFKASMDKIKENDEKARISLSNIGANVAATALNDNAIPYTGDGYERVMLYHYQALNYLRKNDVEGAGVEVRRANAEQEEAMKAHEAEVEEAQKEAEERKLPSFVDNPEFMKRYAQLDELAGKVKNSFQNAYTFYVSGFINEMLQQPNDAYIDYKKALEIYPENIYLQKDVLRLASILKMDEDLNTLKLRFKQDPPKETVGGCELLVLFEEGFVPQKKQMKIPLPIPKVGLLAVAFPIYSSIPVSYSTLSILEDGGAELGMTEPICDFRALSVKALKEKIPVIVTRQFVRLLAKGAATKVAKNKDNVLASIGMGLFNLFTENADQRSWITLPATAQIFRTTLPAGSHKIVLKKNGLPATSMIDVNAVDGNRVILHVVQTGPQFYTAKMEFYRVAPNKSGGSSAAKPQVKFEDSKAEDVPVKPEETKSTETTRHGDAGEINQLEAAKQEKI